VGSVNPYQTGVGVVTLAYGDRRVLAESGMRAGAPGFAQPCAQEEP
jgi:hypothetical protein